MFMATSQVKFANHHSTGKRSFDSFEVLYLACFPASYKNPALNIVFFYMKVSSFVLRT